MTISYTVSSSAVTFPHNMAKIQRRLRRKRHSRDCRERQRRGRQARRFFRIVTGFAKTTPFNQGSLHQAAVKLKQAAKHEIP